MKRIITILIFIIIPLIVSAQTSRPVVDERLELTSIVFRLAGAEEYVCDGVPEYMKEIDEYFAPYKNHKLIGYIQNTLREKQRIGYDGVAASAFALKIKDGKVTSGDDLYQRAIGKDPRWNEEVFAEYVRLLNDFYRKSKAGKFFDAHREFYYNAVQANQELVNKIDLKWFRDTFGGEPINLDVCLGLCTAQHNYGGKEYEDGTMKIVIGTFADQNGTPNILETAFDVVIHEIMHYYSRPLLNKHYDAMRVASEDIYSRIESRMIVEAHKKPRTVAAEWITELFMNMYMQEHGELIMYNIYNDFRYGYIWINRALDFMKNYDRTKYSSMSEFMPHIVDFTNRLPAEWDTIENEFANAYPYVVSTFPVNGSVIPADTKEIKVKFAHPMFDAHGLKPIAGYEMIPGDFRKCHWEDPYTYVIVIANQLESGKKYGIALFNDPFIRLDNGFRLKENYDMIFEVE